MKADSGPTTLGGSGVHPTNQDQGGAPFGRGRHIATRVLAVVGLAAFALSVVIVVGDILNPVANEAALVPAGSPEAQAGADRPAETVHVVGAVAALFVGGSGLAALALHPRWLGSANHTIAAMLASVIAMGVMGDPDNHGGQAGPFDPAFLIFAVPGMTAALAVRPWASCRRHHLARPRFLVLAAAGVPFVWYGTHQALLQRNTWPPLADPHHQAHWYLMAVLAFTIVTVTASAAVTVRGWRLAAVTAALSAIALGATSLVAPAAASALPSLWAALAIAWGGGGLALTWTDAWPMHTSAGPVDAVHDRSRGCSSAIRRRRARTHGHRRRGRPADRCVEDRAQ